MVFWVSYQVPDLVYNVQMYVNSCKFQLLHHGMHHVLKEAIRSYKWFLHQDTNPEYLDIVFVVSFDIASKEFKRLN